MDSFAGLLSDSQVRRQREEGNLVIEPFSEGNLNSCSYDVTLGEDYFRLLPVSDPSPVNPWRNGRSLWGPPCRAPEATEEEAAGLSLSPGDRYVLLPPGETILACTREVIGVPSSVASLTTMMKAKSTTARCCLTVCKDAGWGDVGYCNRWTMQIQNNGKRTVVLPVGVRIAQIVFLRTGQTERNYSGRYQLPNWKPEDMLPK